MIIIMKLHYNYIEDSKNLDRVSYESPNQCFVWIRPKQYNNLSKKSYPTLSCPQIIEEKGVVEPREWGFVYFSI